MYMERNLEVELKDAKDASIVDKYIKRLEVCKDNSELTEIYTEILNDDNVVSLITKISQNPVFLRDFPEFYEENIYGESVINCQQNNMFHTYGVFKHTLVAVENVGNLKNTSGDWQRKILKWAMFLHDIGKPFVKYIKEDATDSFVGHEEKSFELSQNILERFNFSKDEKEIILNLIKYHDTFLNIGEVIHENLEFLANELGGRKDIFYLMIDIKESDAKAKTQEVYEKFKHVKKKYIDFYEEYFNKEEIVITENNDDLLNLNNVIDIIPLKKVTQLVQISNSEYEEIVKMILKKQNISVLYQPVIDIERKEVHFYEAFTKIEYAKEIDMAEFIKYISELDNYNKIQQMLFVNAIEKFEEIKIKDIEALGINIDLESYEKYINKPRIYDVMNRITLIMEANNYDKHNYGKLSETIDKIKAKNGKVLIDNFGNKLMGISEITMLDIDYIKPDIEILKNIDKKENEDFIKELLKVCQSKETKLIAFGVETKEEYLKLKNLGIRYFQGYYFSIPTLNITSINSEILDKI